MKDKKTKIWSFLVSHSSFPGGSRAQRIF